METRDINEDLKQQIAAWMAAENVPGVSLAFLRDGQTAWTAEIGLATVNETQPVNKETLFEAASLTKPLFAHAVLQLVESGALALDTPLLELLPAADRLGPRLLEAPPEERPLRFHYVYNDPRLEQVTIRRLLSHSAGFNNWTGENESLRLHIDPGQRFSYAGDGFNLLQDVVERLRGQPLEALVNDLLFEPLGMRHSGLTAQLAGRSIAKPHDADGKQTERDQWTIPYAAASLHTTAEDFGRFLLSILNPGVPGPGRLSPSMTREMFTPQIQTNNDLPWSNGWPKAEFQLTPGVFWGLGWGLQEADGRRAMWHWGDNGNYKAYTVLYPDNGDGLVMLCNGRGGGNLWRPLCEALLPGPHPALDWLEEVDE